MVPSPVSLASTDCSIFRESQVLLGNVKITGQEFWARSLGGAALLAQDS